MFQRKICVIVGGARGRGRRLIEEYSEKSYQIALMDMDKESGYRLKRKMEEEYGRKMFFFHGDAGSEEDLELFAGAIIGQYGRVDCLYYRKDISERAEQIRSLLAVYLKDGGVVEVV